ncbi:hypothetical protein [Aureivirga sp. CE67]|uniref:hypothetical protein n=1 Tax=Aureivirga sp. CE67 TaxID=1788983 RepID=UPI0018CA9A88|nr:hypothetical protein [Aureivirga sp. CE67]
MKKLTLILLILFSKIIIAQNNEKETSSSISNDYITMDIATPFYLNSKENNTPRWNFGFIKTISNHSKIGISTGYGAEAISLIETGKDYILFEIRPEYYYILNPTSKTLKYFSFEFGYIQQKQLLVDDHYFYQGDLYNYYKADYKREKFVYNLKYGMFINFSKRIGMNIYTGAGVRHRKNTFTNVEIKDIEIDENTGHFPPYYRNKGDKVNFEFSLGFKLYYRLY